MMLRAAILAGLIPAFHSSVLTAYEPAVNPAAFSLNRTTLEPGLDFAWTPQTRPFPGPFGALWLATLTPPPGAPPLVWFRASFGSIGAGAMLKLWVDDHLLVNGQSAATNASVTGYYPVAISPTGALLRVEYAALGEGATAQVAWGPAQGGPWAPLPPSSLSPALPPEEATYQARRSEEEAGWGTFDPNDLLSSVLLPSGLSLSLSFLDSASGQGTGRVQFSCSPALRVGLHAARGGYVEVERLALQGGAAAVRVETATTLPGGAGDLVLLVTTLEGPRAGDVSLALGASVMLPFSACNITAGPAALSALCAGTPPVALRPCSGAGGGGGGGGGGGFSFALPPVGGAVAFSTAPGGLTLAGAAAVVAARRGELLALLGAHGGAGGRLNDTFAGLYAAVAWTTVYSRTQGLINGEFGRSTKLYEWDTLLVGALAARVDGWVALNNVARVARGAVPAGFLPGFLQDEFGEVDNAKPPVAALALRAVFAAGGEAWAVRLVLGKLVAYSAWWEGARMVRGIVAPGSVLDPLLAPVERAGHGTLLAAKWETGLDNSPLYDSATFNSSSGLMSQWDVGMHALVIADALELAALAGEVGRGDLAPALLARAAAATARMEEELWCEEAGRCEIGRSGRPPVPARCAPHPPLPTHTPLSHPAPPPPPIRSYLNKDYVTGAFVPWTAPPTFYPLLTGAPSVARVERMLARYYFNASELCGDPADCAFGLPSISRANPAFAQQDYWRGRAWGPMNWLVYRGLRAYARASPAAAAAARALAEQSRSLFLVDWLKFHHVMENYSPIDGSGCASSGRANSFYHWGALTALVAVEEDEAGGNVTLIAGNRLD